MMMYAFCYPIITIMIHYSEDPALSDTTRVSYAKASIAFFFLYYVFFGIGWQGAPSLYPTEINSLSMRTKGAALGTATNWIFNFMVVEITLQAFNLCNGNSRSSGPSSTSLLCPSSISSTPKLLGVHLKILTASLLAARQCL